MKHGMMMLALALSLATVGCGGGSSGAATTEGETSETSGGQTAASATVVAPGEATIGDTTTCPVSGEQFVVTDASPHVEHEGRTYYFCCAGCDSRFQADPAQYLTAQPAAEPAPAS